jgi:hypothetical protein
MHSLLPKVLVFYYKRLSTIRYVSRLVYNLSLTFLKILEPNPPLILKMVSAVCDIFVHINLLKPTGHVMHQQFNVQQLYVLPHTLYRKIVV